MATLANHNRRPHRERKKPRISLNKLGEYAAEPNPSRRKRIVRDQKRPKDFICAYYSLARNAIVKHVATGSSSTDLLEEEIARLSRKDAKTSWQQQRNQSNQNALRCYIDNMHGSLLRDKIRAEKVSQSKSACFDIRGVRVSVRPDLYLSGVDGHGKPVAGCLKLHFSKNHPLTETSGQYVATVLHRYTELAFDAGVVYTLPRYCKAINIFTGDFYEAPNSYMRRREAIRDACESIASIWPRV